jgi:hypothetical protein
MTMRKYTIAPIVLVIALSLGGCFLDPNGKSVFKGGDSLTASITNPVTPVNIYQVKSVYEKVVDIADEYRAYCYARSYKSLMADPIAGPVCKSRRSIITKLQDADDKAFEAIGKAEDFIKRNPKISAATVVREAWAAVTNFKGVINTAAASAAAVQ